MWTGVSYDKLVNIPFGPALATVGLFIISVMLGAIAVILYSLTTIVRENSKSGLTWFKETQENTVRKENEISS